MSPSSPEGFREPHFFEIGYTGDDSFDQHHTDYEVCWGACHTQKTAKVISAISLFLAFTSMVIATYYKKEDLMIVAGIYIATSMLLIGAVFMKMPRLMLPCIVVSVLRDIFEFYLCGRLGSGLYRILKVDAMSGDQLLLFTFVMLLVAIHASLSIWIIWTLYIHYCYLRDRPVNFTWNGEQRSSWVYRVRRNIRWLFRKHS
ncbi:hypothetical protein L596_015345 [Steinernema carpocapsae]|uniref:Uncharacterized protein n=1 Tax=Steinernema carpocapsae TaxID=34508 RepID=A0A4U5NFK4_STECR|nr:hypothetical protein L596_015345 [Steinernema carpocapsae]